MEDPNPSVPSAALREGGAKPDPPSDFRAPHSIYTEWDLHEIWELQRFPSDGLLTEEAVPVAVEFPASAGARAGPISAASGSC